MLAWGTSGSGGGSTAVDYVCVTGSTVNIRAGACTSYSVLTTASYGDALELVTSTQSSGCGYNWYKVRDGSIVGYVSASYAQPCTPAFQGPLNDTYDDSFDDFDYEEAQNAAGRAGPGAALVLAGLGMMIAN